MSGVVVFLCSSGPLLAKPVRSKRSTIIAVHEGSRVAIVAICPVSIESGIQSGMIAMLFRSRHAINARLCSYIEQRQVSFLSDADASGSPLIYKRKCPRLWVQNDGVPFDIGQTMRRSSRASSVGFKFSVASTVPCSKFSLGIAALFEIVSACPRGSQLHFESGSKGPAASFRRSAIGPCVSRKCLTRRSKVFFRSGMEL
jgi:hypothetical protein